MPQVVRTVRCGTRVGSIFLKVHVHCLTKTGDYQKTGWTVYCSVIRYSRPERLFITVFPASDGFLIDIALSALLAAILASEWGTSASSYSNLNRNSLNKAVPASQTCRSAYGKEAVGSSR